MATLEIEQALYYKLVNTAALTALVGTRIYPPGGNQGNVFPIINYQKISNPIMQNSGTRTRGEAPRFQISIYADGYDSMLAVKAQVIACLENASGNWGTETDYLNIQWCFFEDENDLYDENMKVCGRAMDFIIWHD